ncbi:MAG: bi-domain-containing oxidoreductase [Bacteroidales bacterium]|nr:bi-domain-containing oxidoreductase [Bacteroidales bacterium]
MKQAIVKKGKVLSEDIPAPVVEKGQVLVKVFFSCISAGTESSGVKDSGKPLYKRVMEKPEKAISVLQDVKAMGIVNTYKKVKGLLDGGSATGYSVSGIVVAIGKEVSKYKAGDRVAVAGGGYANHAEYIVAPENLVMLMPEKLDFQSASTVTLGGIAMQGVRRANLSFGEYCVVTGAGILGLLTIQMLKYSGIRVAAIDIDENRLKLAIELGAELAINSSEENPVKTIGNWTGGYGVDAAIFTAATSSSEPLSQAFQMCKKKGKVILVGVSKMEINRADIYSKELDFQISTSYGPGRYDKNYEEKGNDYPYAYVRWTENRNMLEYLRLLTTEGVKVDKLIQGVFPINKVEEAFEEFKKPHKPLIVLLKYEENNNDIEEHSNNQKMIIRNGIKCKNNIINIALVGAGSFATNIHLPNIQKLSDKYKLHCVVNRTGIKAKTVAKQFGANYATTNIEDALSDKDVDLMMICTRHKNHGELVLKCLNAGKHVFVEKPLTTNYEELIQIEEFYYNNNSAPVLMTGFNRRFSKYTTEIKKHTDKRVNPLFIYYRMNAGYLPKEHWVHEDGGRIVGECCHIIDLMTSFTNSEILTISVDSLAPKTDYFSESDNKTITLKYKDGSVCCIQYFALGSRALPKEYMEVHFDEKTIIMEDFKTMKGYGLKVKEVSTSVSQKGHLEELERLQSALSGDDSSWPIELWDMLQTTKVTLEAIKE